MPLGVEPQIAQQLTQPADLPLQAFRAVLEQQGRRGDHQIVRRLQAEKATDDQVRELIVFAAADAVQKQIAQHHPRVHRGDQRPRPELDAQCSLIHPLLDASIRVGVGRNGQRKTHAPQVADFQPLAAVADKHPLAVRRLGGPNPKRRFKPLAVGCQVRYGMRSAADAVRVPVFRQGRIVNLLKTGQMGQQMRREPRERRRAADAAERQFQGLLVPLGFEPMAGFAQAMPQIRRPPRGVDR